MLRRLIAIFMALVLSIGCASKRPPQIEERPSARAIEKAMKRAEADLRPKWVDTPPSDPDFFYGVGVASAEGGPAEDRKKADNAARLEIASQLKIKISSVVLDITQYKQEQIGGKSREEWSEEYSERMSAIVDTTALEGSKIIERWRDARIGTYYALAQMSRSEFEAKVRKQIEDAKNLALDQYYHAQEAQNSGTISTALKYYANALAELQVIQDIPLEADLNMDGTKEYFRPEVERRMDEIISDLKILTINDNQRGKIGKPLQRPLIVKVLYKRMAVQGMPFTFTFVRGKGQLDKNAQTNSVGKASAKVYKAESVGTNVVEAKVDLDAMVGSWVVESLGRLEAPKSRFVFSSEAIKVVVRISEKNLGEPMADSFVEEAIVERLAQAGFMVVSKVRAKQALDLADIEEAMLGNDTAARTAGKKLGVDIVILGRASTKFSSEVMEGVKSCHARVTVRAIDVHSGEVLAAKDLSELKGFANTKEKAGIKALKEASEQISTEVVEQLKTSL